MIQTRKIALVSAALVVTATFAAACGSSKKSTTPPAGDIVVRGDGSPADFACNGSFTDPATLNSNIGFNVLTTEQHLDGTTPPLSGTYVVPVDLATAATNGTAVLSNGSGLAVITTKDNTRIHLKGRHDPMTVGATTVNYVDTTAYNFITPSVISTSGQYVLRMIPQTIYSAFVGLLGVLPADVVGKYQLAGSIGDCTQQDAQIMNATVELPGGHRCGESTAVPCIAYISNNTPNTGAKHTDSTGAFIIVGLTPNTQTTVKIMGITTAGQAATQIGELTVNGKPDTVSLGVATPLRN